MRCSPRWVNNEDAGFVQTDQRVKIKLAAYPFQKYGMVEGKVQHISPDASEAERASAQPTTAPAQRDATKPLAYRALVALATPHLDAAGSRYRLTPGMQVTAEIHLGSRTVLEYLLSPVQKVVSEAGRER